MCHVITKIIKTKFVIGAIGYVCFVSFSSLVRIGLVVVDTVNGQAVKLKKWCFPGAVTLGQIVVYGYKVHTISRKGIQIKWQRCDQRFSFTCLHFSNFSFVKYHATNELHVIMNHVPRDLLSCGVP